MSTPPAAPPTGRRYQQQLARRLRLAGNLTITLSVIGPAASVFAIGSVALRQQGSGAFLAFVIAAVISACLAVGWAELGVLYPTAGGLYGIVARVLGRRAGFLALALQLALFVIVPSAFALAAGEYLAAVWPAVGPRTAALVLLAAAAAVTVAGIRFNAAVTAALLALELTIILVVSALGFAHADWSMAGTLLDPRVYAADGSATPITLRALLGGVVLGMGAYAGYGGAVIFSEETRGPRRRIAGAMLGALGVAVVAELLAITAALLGAPAQAELTTAPAPMSHLVRSLGGDRLVTTVTLALLATFFNILLAVLLEYARILYSTGRDRTWPAPLSRALGRVHPRTRTPVVATLTVGVAALALTAVSDYAAAVTFASLTVVATFGLIALSALVGRWRQPDLARVYRMPLWPLPPLLALAGVVVTVLLQRGRDLAVVAGILAAGLLYEAAYLRPRRGTHWILLEPAAGPTSCPTDDVRHRAGWNGCHDSASDPRLAGGQGGTAGREDPTMADDVTQYPSTGRGQGASGWVVGLTLFAAVMMIMGGIWQAVSGLIAIFQNEFYLQTRNYIFQFDATAWGWIHLVLGLFVAFVGWSLLSGRTWARVVGITLVALSATANFLFIPYYPVWSILIITLDILVIWALAAHGREFREMRDAEAEYRMHR